MSVDHIRENLTIYACDLTSKINQTIRNYEVVVCPITKYVLIITPLRNSASRLFVRHPLL